MSSEIAFNSINELILRKFPVKETLQAIVSQVLKQKGFALARIWLLDIGDICSECPMRTECPNQDRCLQLKASQGLSLQGKTIWGRLDGSFRRIPIGARKIGHVAKSGESFHLSDLQSQRISWIVNEDWIKAEKIEGFAAHPLKFQDEILGVIGVFSRMNISEESYEWLHVFAEQASIAIANARAFEEIEKLRQRLEEENDYLKEEIQESAQHKFLIGESPIWKQLLRQIELVGSSEATVLLAGESGTGKELVARALHNTSARKHKALVKVNCAAISSELFESEFFGHAKGAFTGAFKDRTGRFQLADGGTIFLDEIGELPLQMQGKLLRVMQERQFERVGEDHTRTVDVRVISATNKDLWAEVENGRFRQDLYYRLSVFPISLPPLRDRIEDIELLARHFLTQHSLKTKCEPFELTAENVRSLQSYRFPGNVRELQNMIERAVILSQCSTLEFAFPDVIEQFVENKGSIVSQSRAVLTYRDLKDLERENIIQALRETNYKVYGTDGAAELLGSKPTTLLSRIKALGIPTRPEN